MKNKTFGLWYVGVILLVLSLSGIALAKTNVGLILSTSLKSASNPEASIGIEASNAMTARTLSVPQVPGDKPAADNKSTLSSLALPIRAAFYYPWFPEAWTQQSIYPYTNYTPTLGYYDLANQVIIKQQINAMLYGYIQAGIASWWGQGSDTDNRMPALLSAAAGTTFEWSIYYEPEGQGNPDVSTLTEDLTYLRDQYSNDAGFLRIDNRFVVFVYADANDGCDMVNRWHQANTVNAYIVLKVFPGYQACPNQPDGWHQYAPAVAADSQGQYSYTISPGFWKAGEDPKLVRNLTIWQQNIHDMIASGAEL